MKKVCLGLFAAACSASAAMAQMSDNSVKIGVLTDQTGVFSSLAGKGSVVAAQMAIEDFGNRIGGKPVELVSADHQNKADIGAQTARRWYDTEGVDMIIDVPNSSVVLAVQQLAREKNRVLIVSGAGTADLTNKACSPNGIHWTWDTYAAAVSTAKAIVQEGGKSWFFLTADYAFGHTMKADVARVVEESGGKVVGGVQHPLNTADFSSFLLQAPSSGADVIALANGGSDTINSLKQAQEFGLTQKAKIAGLAIFLTDIHAIGLPSAQGLYLTTGFYWDQNDETRAWSQRFFKRHGAMPTMSQAGVYSAIMHYLKAIEAAGTDAADKVVAQMKATPVNDFFAKNGKIRDDGRMVHDMYLAQVKSPSESKGPWDYYKILRTVPGDEAFRPLSQSECPLVAK
ncbi:MULTISPECIES: ABC transporter substrate-binding protein [unclassified Chelatococcus]|uniref:ABC transporter substrate-binding protein n=1 Tax=unclassified Chelatococcus TaxID=2638111 RepID=UPI001BCD33AB|nr:MULTISPECIES: ABC transporter substrate-binding protein [unclassified Chelatococcus]MBS7699668.1 ABC transporter substrate-binding protein [Chelatococcus sp. YT9]MBX3557134.1 ABC transporter substrate-binding protein [Chelatococcus sp.]